MLMRTMLMHIARLETGDGARVTASGVRMVAPRVAPRCGEPFALLSVSRALSSSRVPCVYIMRCYARARAVELWWRTDV
eukprot:2273570-Prymnesium_polylepis.1